MRVLMVGVPPPLAARVALAAAGAELVVASDPAHLSLDEVGVVLVGPDATGPVSLVQGVHRARPDVGVVVFADARQESLVRGALAQAPFVPLDVRTVRADADGAVRGAVGDAVRRAHGRARHADLLDAASRQLATAPPPQPPAEPLLTTLLDELPVGVLVLDAEGWVLRANPSARVLLGAREHETAPRAVVDLAARARDGDARAELELAGDDGETRRLELVAHARELEAGRDSVVLLAHDVTERARHREEIEAQAAALRRRNEELAASNRLLDQYARVVAHDLREPLRVVTLFGQLLARRYGDQLDETAREYIGFCVEGADRMQQLVSGLLHYARSGGALACRPVPLDGVIDDAVGNVGQLLADSGGSVAVGPLPSVLGDRAQIVQVFQNLLDNALRFRAPGHAPRVKVEATNEGRRVRVRVSDDGIGIPREHVERVFGVFEQLHVRSAYGGIGIGLAIVKRVVDGHGGRVWLESTPGSGTTVFVELPAASEAILR